MRRILSLLIVVCAATALSSHVSTAAVSSGNASLRVNESLTRLLLRGQANEVLLAVENAAGEQNVRVKIELIAPNDAVEAAAEREVILKHGTGEIALPLENLAARITDNLVYYRLRYEIAAGGESLRNTLAVSEIAPEIFEIEASSSGNLRENLRYLVRTRAVQPVSLRGVSGVKMAGEIFIEFDGEQPPMIVKAENTTDVEGYALLRFNLPSAANVDDAKLTLTGSKNNLQRTAENDELIFSDSQSAYLQTDKPLYQPGQSLRVRTLFFSSSNRAVPNADLTFEILDPEDTTIQRIKAKTSRFGVASIEWQIPENSKLGEYSVKVETDGETDINRTMFKVSRYDLPNFVVSAKPDKKFYLPTDKSAEVEVRADYLFGKSVTRGRVRIVEEKNREWSYKSQKYETSEGAAHEGEFDADGKFTAKFDLSERHTEFNLSRWNKFEDVHFAAYVTDLTTNRTEQRRFDVRLTKEAIHVYLIENDNLSSRLPAPFYVSTFYADGTPAECAVKIYSDKGTYLDPQKDKFLLNIQTNKLGAGKFFFPIDKFDDGDIDFIAEASDGSGRIGTAYDDYNFRDKPAVQISTDKTIYRAGESVKVEIRASEPQAILFVDVVRRNETIRAERVTLKNGRGVLRLPYQPDFQNALTIAAHGSYRDEDGDDETFVGTKTVIFPRKTGLQIAAETKAVYRPGENAAINFTTARADGKSEETALGVVILDKAIEERARADADFGSRYNSFNSGFSNLLGLNQGFGGITLRDLNNLDLRRKPSAELNLAAEIALRNSFVSTVFRSREFHSELAAAFAPAFKKQFEPIRILFFNRYLQQEESPANAVEMQRILSAAAIDFAAMRDPWNNFYRADFTIDKNVCKLEIKSAGADKRFETADDLIAHTQEFKYFQPTEAKLNRAVFNYHERTGAFVRDYQTLRDEAARENVDLDNLRDAYGNPYHVSFEIKQGNFVVTMTSGGANGKLDPNADQWRNDDFSVWTNSTDSFTVTRANMIKAVGDYVKETGKFPANEKEFAAVLKSIGFDLDVLRDVYNQPYYLTRTINSRFADNVIITNNGGANSEIKPVTQQIVSFAVKSRGADKISYFDDFELVTFNGVISEQTKDDVVPKNVTSQTVTTDTTGAISGAVADANAAAIPNVKISAVLQNAANQTFETTSDADGRFLLHGLPAGNYEIAFDAVNFKRTILQNVKVQVANETQINVSLEVGGIAEAVTVMSERGGGGGGGGRSVDTTDAQLQTTITSRQLSELPINGRGLTDYAKLKPGMAHGANNQAQQIETPRLREYFPETLVWQPELITDAGGKAELKFKLADSLTTWKMAVIGSTVDGEIGVMEKEFQAFQPFFAEHEPPKILTEGDKIALPVVLRNYTDAPQNVTATMANADWFRLSSQPTQKITVAPNAAEKAIFDFEAVASIKNGKQKVTAVGTDASDAIEKPVSVHPNGREIVETKTEVFSEAANFAVNFPADALPRTSRAELKIYPNLMAHVVESIEGILARPYGCGEQTISSTYPSILILQAGRKNGGDPALQTKARKYLQLGYERLLGYQTADNGFSYWGGAEAADAALTAYALQFLMDAKEFIDVDENLTAETRGWLVKQQTADGSWAKKYAWETAADDNRTLHFTAYTAKVLAKTDDKDETTKTALKNALSFLKKRQTQIIEPYILANFALASFAAGDEAAALQIADRLRGAAKSEGGTVYWNLEANTPFNGWGTAGRTETTALVLQVLRRADEVRHKENDVQIAKGLGFLLANKDRYGVWYSTQTTVNVLQTLIALIPPNSANGANRTEIFINNNKIKELALPAANELSNPILLDLTEYLKQPNNRVEIRQSGNLITASAQIVQSHYAAWKDENGFRANDSDGLRLRVDYDKTSAAMMDEITCRVAVERIGFRGYGMILAEIGLPPGADVSRESFAETMKNNSSVSRYDILPDKIIVYLWAYAGGTKFDFKFKPRYGIEANTAASTAYDYYNPESQAALAPTKFSVR